MTKIVLQVEPGETIEDSAIEAQRIADRCEWSVMFEFNGVECFAVPGGDSARLVENQQQAQATKPRVFSDEEVR